MEKTKQKEKQNLNNKNKTFVTSLVSDLDVGSFLQHVAQSPIISLSVKCNKTQENSIEHIAQCQTQT